MPEILMHGRMLADRRRCDAYARAIASTVRPGDVVLDLGTGTGIHAVLAARAGARKVYAIESSGIIHLAREVAAANGVGHCIEFIHATSELLTLAERADVLVADVRGVLPYFATSLRSLVDARKRLMRAGARIIPRCDMLQAALVESDAAVFLHRDAWSHESIDLSPAVRLAASITHKHLFRKEELLSASEEIGAIDYSSVATADLEATAAFLVTRDGRADGAAIWFDSVLAEGVEMSNAPGNDESLYGQLFVPFEEPVAVASGDVVTLHVTARIFEDDADYLWRWRTTLTRGGESRLLFDQSSFFATPEILRKGE